MENGHASPSPRRLQKPRALNQKRFSRYFAGLFGFLGRQALSRFDFLRGQRLIGCSLDMYFPCTILAGAIGSFRICVSIGHGRLNGWRFERLPARKDFPRAERRTTPGTHPCGNARACVVRRTNLDK